MILKWLMKLNKKMGKGGGGRARREGELEEGVVTSARMGLKRWEGVGGGEQISFSRIEPKRVKV